MNFYGSVDGGFMLKFHLFLECFFENKKVFSRGNLIKTQHLSVKWSDFIKIGKFENKSGDNIKKQCSIMVVVSKLNIVLIN